jgi:hypothetical protein
MIQTRNFTAEDAEEKQARKSTAFEFLLNGHGEFTWALRKISVFVIAVLCVLA